MMNKKRAAKTGIVLILLFGYYLFVKNTGLGIPCPIQYFFHLKCPGCGVTHMLLSLLQGKPSLAYHYHPVLLLASPFLLYLIVRMLYGYLWNRKIVWRTWENVTIIILIIILIIFTIYRNLCILF